MEKCCNFIHEFKKIRWTKTALIICLLPFVLLLFVFIIILLCTVETLGAVVSNSRACAKVGAQLLSEGGSAVDAAIGTMLCEGVALPSSAGIGGGFTAIIRIDGDFDSIVATPTFPGATADFDRKNSSCVRGAKVAGIPGELKGYWEMHQKYGMLPWKQIFEPTIELCNKGVPITEWFAGVLRFNAEKLAETPSMKDKFPEWKKEDYQQDFKITYPNLSITLQKIAQHGADIFYDGEVGKEFIKDVQDAGGLLTLDDLKNYKVLWSKELPRLRMLQRYKIVTTPLPTSGIFIVLVLNIIKSMEHEDITSGLLWHTVVEAMRHAFGMAVLLGDPKTDPEYADDIMDIYNKMESVDFAQKVRRLISPDRIFNNTAYRHTNFDDIFGKGSANICVLAPNGDIVASTTSLLHQFGAFFSSESTGIILNNIFCRFFGAVNMPNRPLPYKHVLTPFTPVVILDNLNKPFFILGASGGPRGIATVVNAIIRYIFFEENAHSAINAEPFFPLINSNRVEFGENIDSELIAYLRRVGHEMFRRYFTYDNYTAVTAIGHRNRRPSPQFDAQVGGSYEYVKPTHELGFIVVAIVGVLCVSVFGLMLYEVLHPRKTTSFTLS